MTRSGVVLITGMSGTGKSTVLAELAGCVSNQGRFYDRFDAVVLLTVPAHVMLQRIAERATSEFGKDPRERERILRDLREVEPLLAATSTAVIDATRPLSEVADAVERFGVAT